MAAHFGLDIGSSSIKLIQLAGKPKKYKLNSFGLAVNPVGSVEFKNEPDRIRVAQEVKKLVLESGIKSRKAVLALPEAAVYTRVLQMPVLSDVELASAINWEAEQYIPIPISEVKLDYQILSKPEGNMNGKMRVFLVAAPITVVNKFVNLAEVAGLEVVALETEIVALTRSLVIDNQAGSIMMISLGAATADLFIIENGNVIFTRSIPTGGNALTRALANDLGLQNNQAEQYKRSYGLDATQLQGKVQASLAVIFASVVAEAKKAIRFYATSRQASIVRVVLTGGGAYLPAVTSVLAKELGLEVLLANPLAGIEVSQTQKKRMAGIVSVFSVAVGLAMRED